MNELEKTHSQYDPKGLSWGALGLTPFWLFINGFWVMAAITVGLNYFFWPAGIVISLFFFFKGRELSWGNGNRWDSVEKFEESQEAWNLYGVIALVVITLLLVIQL